jgi:hypothetical protein
MSSHLPPRGPLSTGRAQAEAAASAAEPPPPYDQDDWGGDPEALAVRAGLSRDGEPVRRRARWTRVTRTRLQSRRCPVRDHGRRAGSVHVSRLLAG